MLVIQLIHHFTALTKIPCLFYMKFTFLTRKVTHLQVIQKTKNKELGISSLFSYH